MEFSQTYFEERAAQCRRLAQTIGDQRTIDQLLEMAGEFDLKAREAADADQREA